MKFIQHIIFFKWEMSPNWDRKKVVLSSFHHYHVVTVAALQGAIMSKGSQ